MGRVIIVLVLCFHSLAWGENGREFQAPALESACGGDFCACEAPPPSLLQNLPATPAERKRVHLVPTLGNALEELYSGKTCTGCESGNEREIEEASNEEPEFCATESDQEFDFRQNSESRKLTFTDFILLMTAVRLGIVPMAPTGRCASEPLFYLDNLAYSTTLSAAARNHNWQRFNWGIKTGANDHSDVQLKRTVQFMAQTECGLPPITGGMGWGVAFMGAGGSPQKYGTRVVQYLNRLVEQRGMDQGDAFILYLIGWFPQYFRLGWLRVQFPNAPIFQLPVPPELDNPVQALLANKLTPNLEFNNRVAASLSKTLVFGNTGADFLGKFLHNHPVWSSIATLGWSDFVIRLSNMYYGTDMDLQPVSRRREAALLAVNSVVNLIAGGGGARIISATVTGVRGTFRFVHSAGRSVLDCENYKALLSYMTRLAKRIRTEEVTPLRAMRLLAGKLLEERFKNLRESIFIPWDAHASVLQHEEAFRSAIINKLANWANPNNKHAGRFLNTLFYDELPGRPGRAAALMSALKREVGFFLPGHGSPGDPAMGVNALLLYKMNPAASGYIRKIWGRIPLQAVIDVYKAGAQFRTIREIFFPSCSAGLGTSTGKPLAAILAKETGKDVIAPLGVFHWNPYRAVGVSLTDKSPLLHPDRAFALFKPNGKVIPIPFSEVQKRFSAPIFYFQP